MPTRARRFTSQASVGMFASRIPSSQLSKNDSFSTVKKRPVLHYTCAGRSICASFAPLGVYIYAVGGESCTTRHPLLRSARRAAPTVTARGTSGRVRRVESALGFSTVPHGDAPASFARHSRRDAASPEYRFLASLAPVGAIREPHPRVSLRSALGHSPRFLITC